MTLSPAAARGDVFLPGRPADRHTTAARALLEALHRRLPAAGLGVAGSVGRGDHTDASDIDLVVAGEFQRDVSFAFRYRGIGIAVTCLRAGGNALSQGPASPGVVDPNTPYVLNARVERDEAGHLERVRGALRENAAARAARHTEWAAHLHGRAEELLEVLEQLAPSGDEAHAGPLRYELFSALLAVWCLRHDVVLDEKAKSHRLFATVAGRDPAFHALLRATLPLRAASDPALAAAWAALRTSKGEGSPGPS